MWGRQPRNEQYSRNYIKVDMQELSALSLVCRKWATLCRPKLFEWLDVRSVQDLEPLISFARNPMSDLKDHLDIIRCYPETPSIGAPWFHTACSKLRPKFGSSLPRVYVRVTGAESKKLTATLQS